MIGLLPGSRSLVTKLGSCSLFSGHPSNSFSTRVLSNKNKTQFQLDCETLNVVPENCDEESARSSFIKLAKRYHPDSKSPEANANKFDEINTAYKNLLKKFAEDRHNQHVIEGEYGLYYEFKKKQKVDIVEEEEETDANVIDHTTPQHRRYLSYEGVGTLSQRQKQNEKRRAAKAAARVHDHRINQLIKDDTVNTEEKALVDKDKQAARNSKTSNAIERVVEDMILESMARGEFNNLKGQGKPLKHDTSYNPYIDFTTHKLNQVLIDNGFTPEWILLEKEIRQELRDVRQNIAKERHKYDKEMTHSDLSQWEIFIKGKKLLVDDLNMKIQKYNLVVPILHKQIFCIDLDKEAKKALDPSNFSDELRNNYVKNPPKCTARQTSALDNQNESFLGFLFSFIKS